MSTFNAPLQCITSSRFHGCIPLNKTKTPVKRNIKQAGLMTKDVGQQASYRVPYESVPTVTPVKSEKPRQTTIKRIEEQNQLRMDIKKYNPAIQAINFAFMQGFLPNFAKEQYAKAAEKKLINHLGRPNTSSFVTYAYCAGLHVDNDESVTHGWVIKRGIKVTRQESNFVWGNYKLILELNQGSHWFWRSDTDAHGTMTNRIVMKHPGTWKTPERLDSEEDAQWTWVNTIPKAVADATLRSQE
ncbi:hypothetical protein L208DRAFT_1382841 [Tricholoma matsutake]|nr:hypothetical protein L208DRAFT_1382841 [Tricholoma matsutake 945]